MENKYSNLTIGITTVAFSKNDELVDRIKKYGFKSIKINSEFKRFSKLELKDFLYDCDIAIVGLDKIDEELLIQLPKLKLISKYGVGIDNIDFSSCERHNIKVVYPKGVNKRSVSELALGYMLSLARNIYTTSNSLKYGEWNKSGGFEITGKKIGIIGLGHIGKDLVKLLKPFDCKIYANDLIEFKEFCNINNIKQTSKEYIYKNCDIISLHLPHTKETNKIINETTLKQFKKGSILINTARGELIEYTSLKKSLKDGTLKAAGIDVYSEEPPTDIELINNHNLINTPHIGGNSKEAVFAMGKAAIENIIQSIKL